MVMFSGAKPQTSVWNWMPSVFVTLVYQATAMAKASTAIRARELTARRICLRTELFRRRTLSLLPFWVTGPLANIMLL